MGIPRRQVLSPMRLRTASSANVSRRPGITVPFPNPVLTLFGHTGDRPMHDQVWHVVWISVTLGLGVTSVTPASDGASRPRIVD